MKNDKKNYYRVNEQIRVSSTNTPSIGHGTQPRRRPRGDFA